MNENLCKIKSLKKDINNNIYLINNYKKMMKKSNVDEKDSYNRDRFRLHMRYNMAIEYLPEMKTELKMLEIERQTYINAYY
jgi:hypothetical protein